MKVVKGTPPRCTARLAVILALAIASGTCKDEVVAPDLVPGPAANAAVSALARADRDVLVALYNATDGPNWSRSDSWLTEAPVNDWYGVVTDSEGRVRWLTLWDNGLKGPIVAELGNLTALEFLGLGGQRAGRRGACGVGNRNRAHRPVDRRQSADRDHSIQLP